MPHHGPAGGPRRFLRWLFVAAAVVGVLVPARHPGPDPVAATAVRALASPGPAATTSVDPPPRQVPGAPGAPAAPAAPGARYAWPLVPAPVVHTPFRAPEHTYGPGHRGVDLVGVDGQPVLAARAGRVVFAGPVGGRPVVSVLHDDGLRTTYEPVASEVAAGAVVAAGDLLGVLRSGHRGCSGPCLHLGARRGPGDYVDPLVLLRSPHVRLLPVPPDWTGS